MLTDLQSNLERIANGVRADWAIYAQFVGLGEEIAVNADASVDTMSVIKLPLLVALFQAHDGGRVDLDRRITLATGHKRFGTGVLQTLGDGATFTLRDAAMLMIIQSDNSATDLCFEAVGGPEAVNATMTDLGLAEIRATGTAFDWFRALAATMDPTYADCSPEALFRRGYPRLAPGELAAARERFHLAGQRPFGLATARATGRLLAMIWRNECASRAACDEMRRILRLQQFRTRIPRYLFGATVAHKTGDFDPFIANDVGVIEPFGRSPIIACFFSSRHRGLWANLEDAIARMSEQLWAYELHRSAPGA